MAGRKNVNVFCKKSLTDNQLDVIIIIENEREVTIMKTTGIIRRVDDSGRIVIPKEIRKQLKIGESDPLEIFLSKNGEIILKPYRPDYILRKADDWEELEDSRGNVVAQGHRLSAEEVLFALGVDFHVEELEED